MTSFTQTYVANLALAHLGDHRINDVSDNKPMAANVRDQWDIARLDSLSAYEWGFASKIVQLNRNGTAPDAEWTYRYDMPGDFVRLTAVADSSAFNRRSPFRKWAFRGGYIETDATTVFIDYVRDHETVGGWPPYFVDHMAVSLARRLNPKITTSQSTGQTFDQMQAKYLLIAKARDAQQQPVQRPPVGNWLMSLRRGSTTGGVGF